jgi:signal transduction histidine kinase/ligand-binding sensor domain-containing protein
MKKKRARPASGIESAAYGNRHTSRGGGSRIFTPKQSPLSVARACLKACAALLVCSASASALDPAKSVGQYVHDEWQTRDGLPDDVVWRVAQTPDGYLWLATSHGLVRFDGARFVTFDRLNTSGLDNFDVQALAVGRDGALWVGTNGGGLARFRAGRFETYTTAGGLTNDSVRTLFFDGAGALWIGTRGGLQRLRDGRFQTYTTREGLSHDDVRALAEGPDGSIWIATQSGLDHFDNGVFTNYFRKDGLPDENVWSVFVDSGGGVWTGAGSDAKTVSRLKDGRFTVFTEREGYVPNPTMAFREDRDGQLWVGSAQRFRDGRFLPGISFGPHVICTYEDAEGSVWFGTNGRGLHRLKDGRFTTYTSAEGLPGRKLGTVHVGARGSLWLGLDEGTGVVSRFDGGRFKSVGANGGMPPSGVLALDDDGAGDLWAATYNMGLARLRGDSPVKVYTTKDGLPVDKILALAHDADGSVWVGTNGGGLARFRDEKFETYTTREGLLSDTVHAVLVDSVGRVWAGTMSGLSCVVGGKVVSYADAPGLAHGAVYALREGRDGAIWIGTSGGLSRLRDGRFANCTTAEGLFDDVVNQIVVDDAGDVWMGHPRGVSRVAARDFEEFAAGRAARVGATSFGVEDGLKVAKTSDFGEAAKTPDGRLWFPTPQGVAVVDPKSPAARATAPPVIVEGLTVDDRPSGAGGYVEIPAGSHRLEFQYTATSFLDPLRVRFRYKLEGFDRDWIDAGARRSVSYTNLPPGRYRFRVTASPDGVNWSEAGASFDFRQRPRFYQTAWFYLLCAALVAAAAWRLYRLRLRRMRERVEARFAVVLEERSRIAREIHDTLAQGFAGISMQLESVDEVMDVDRTEARAHLDAARTLARSSLTEARRSIWSLRAVSPAGDDLPSALARWARQTLAPAGVGFEREVRGAARRLPAFVEDNLFRVAQEAITNAVKHARAKSVRLVIDYGEKVVRLQVSDDGCGFDARAPRAAGEGGFGVGGMRERAERLGGRLSLESRPGAGTTVTVTAPATRAAKTGRAAGGLIYE